MELNILKIDLDCKSYFKVILKLSEKLAYMHDLDFFNIENIEKIELFKKTSYGCRIVLKKDLPSEKEVVLFQLILGSDYKKEVNNLINHYKLKMDYSNRLFLMKRYKKNIVLRAKIEDITERVKDYVTKYDKRKKYSN